MKTTLLATIFALTCGLLYAQTPPPQASAAGYSTLGFDDEFTSASTIAPNLTASTGYKWYPFKTANLWTLNPGGTGTLVINTDTSGYGQDLQTIPMSAAPTITAGTFQYGYFEASMQFNPRGHTSGAWPAFWSFSASAQTVVNGQHSAELDFMEAYPNGALTLLIDTIHEWISSGGGATGSGSQNSPDWLTVNPTDGGYHTYGCLHTPGKLQWYLDNKPVTFSGGATSVATGPGTKFPTIETSRIYLILGTGANWPTSFDWVHVWQAGGVTPPPNLLPQTLTFTYNLPPVAVTLPAKTDQGQPVTYTTTFANATIVGNTLSAPAGSGAIPVDASAPATATYAAYSGTETVTIP